MSTVMSRLLAVLDPRTWRSPVQLLVAGALVFLVSAAGTWWVDDRSAFPAWLSSVATFAAFAAAAVAARYAAQVQARESRRDQARARDQRRAQADRVAAWVAQGPVYGTTGAGQAAGTLQVLKITVAVRNASELPVTNVDVAVYHYVKDRPEPAFIASIRHHLLPPGATTERVLALSEIAPLGIAPDVERGARVMAIFTDAGGRRWMRGTDAKLTRIPNND